MKRKTLSLLIALSILLIIITTIIYCYTPVKAEPLTQYQPEDEQIVIYGPQEYIIPEIVKEVQKQEEILNKTESEIEIVLEEFSIPPINTNFKSWMPYTAITNKTSPAYKLQYSENTYTDENGLRKVNEDYCVAMGTFYSTTIGDRFKITLDNGNEFNVIISDIKANQHTDKTNRYTLKNYCMLEFLIDKTKLNPDIKNTGSVSALDFFNGQIIKVEKL